MYVLILVLVQQQQYVVVREYEVFEISFKIISDNATTVAGMKASKIFAQEKRKNYQQVKKATISRASSEPGYPFNPLPNHNSAKCYHVSILQVSRWHSLLP